MRAMASLPLLNWGRNHVDDMAAARVEYDRTLDLPEDDTVPRRVDVRQHDEAAGARTTMEIRA
jgi:hypothetical protein